MDRRTDGGDYNIPFAFLKKGGDNYPVGKESNRLIVHYFSKYGKMSMVYCETTSNSFWGGKSKILDMNQPAY